MIEILSKSYGGINIGGSTFSVFCYADDVQLCSLTASGLQYLINTATAYIESHGLRFNPSKTSCVLFGPHTLQTRPEWYMNGVHLDETDTINYLNNFTNTAKCHTESRIQSSRKSFYCLQSTGLCSGGISPDSMRYVWNAAIRPVPPLV